MSAPKASAALTASVTDTVVRYEVVVDGEAELSVVLYNDFTRRSAALEDGVNRGEFTGLKPNVQYTVAVVCKAAFGERTLSERRVVTSALPAVTEWRGISHECTCNVDGYFHFKMDFVDKNNYWSDFTATLTDAKGTVSECVFTEDLAEEQRIDVALHGGLLGNRAEFVVTCKTRDPSAPSETLELYRAEVAI